MKSAIKNYLPIKQDKKPQRSNQFPKKKIVPKARPEETKQHSNIMASLYFYEIEYSLVIRRAVIRLRLK